MADDEECCDRDNLITIQLDILSFIQEIKNRPAIWDINAEEYGDRVLKKQAWDELVAIFINKEDPTKLEKNEFIRMLTRRWKSLRDCYSRELKNQKKSKSGSGSNGRSVYVYFNHLSFLSGAATIKESSNSSDEQDLPLAPIVSLRGSRSPIFKKKKYDLVANKIINSMEKNGQYHHQEREKDSESDSDRMFLLSLLSPLKRIPEHARFGVKRKLMDVIEVELNLYSQSPTSKKNR